MNRRIAMISVHECPLAAHEGKERGGINVYVYELSKALANQGWQIDAFTRVQDDTNPRIVHVQKNFRVVHLSAGPHKPLSKFEIVAALPQFTKNLEYFIETEQVKYDLLHAHYYFSGEVVRNLNAISQQPIPWVTSFHTTGRMKQLVAHSNRTMDPHSRNELEEHIAHESQKIVVSSESEKLYLSAFFDTPAHKMVTIPPGVDTSLFTHTNTQEARKKLGIDPHTPIVLAVGRIDPVKGFDTLLVSLKILINRQPHLKRSVQLWIVGGDLGQDKRLWSKELIRLESLRRDMKLLTTVRFIPPQHQEQLPHYYNAADVLVMPSHYESFGMVALEALSCGTPVIVTDVTGISPTLKELPHNHIIGANNPIALSQELEHVLCEPHTKSPPKEIDQFDWSVIAKKMSALYRSLDLV